MAMLNTQLANGGADETSARRSPVWISWLERALLFMGLVGLLYCLAAGTGMFTARRAAEGFSSAQPGAESRQTSDPGDRGVSAYAAADAQAGRPAVVGRVEIPAIGLVTPLLAGDDSMSLIEGAGHIPGTALPGGLGTVGIAGHRDTHFRLLAKATSGMEVRLVTRQGVYRYRVTSSEIVTPEQVSVLDIGQVPGLALVTCYPFRFIGHAPKRYIVHAELLSAAPDAARQR